MDNISSNRVNMIRTTHDFCVANAAATAGIGAFAGVVISVNNKLTLINALDQIAMGTTTGVTLDTNALRFTMSDIAEKLANAVGAYANSVSNNTLAATVNYTRAKLDKLKKDEVDDVSETIHQAAQSNIAAAGAFGYAVTDVTDLISAINLYRASIQSPRQKRIEISDAKRQIGEHIDETLNELLKKQLDKMANTLKNSNANFYNQYYQAREIIDLGATSGKVRGTVTDQDDNTLNGVLFTIRKTGLPDIVGQTTTANGGKFGIYDLPPGDYDFTWELTGFQTRTENNVHLAAGKELQRTITMLPV